MPSRWGNPGNAVAAGDSAGLEARRQFALAEAHERKAVEARLTAANYSAAEATERQTVRTLAPLSSLGYFLLADRRWPGSRRAQVDLVVVGPGGVFIVDTKAWREVSVVGGRVLRGDADVTDEIASLADLVHITHGDFAEIGLAPGEVHAVVVLAGRSGIDASVEGVRIVGERDVLRLLAAHGQRLSPTQVDAVVARAISFFPQVGAPAPVVAAVPEPVLPALREGHVQDALLSCEEVNDALLEAVLAEPIEQWMSFLHPSQAKLVRRSFLGPSRIRGPAGSGKTVVGLHRAAHLARHKPGRVLVTTYVRTLPAVLKHLLERLAPETVGRVDFTGVHQFARRLLDDRGVNVRLHPQGASQAFKAAWERVGMQSSLAEGGRGPRYWDDEIQYVLKGRGITQFDDYADLARTGRRFPLSRSGREAVWALYEAYDAELRRRGVIDYADLILQAEEELRREPMRGVYSAVVIDEAQDLSCAMVRMLHALVGDEADGLTLIGDGQQSIYPGGYTLAEAGLSVAGRGVVLDVNYRNTAQIVSFAQRLVAGDEYSDIEGTVSSGDVPSSVPRAGPDPVIVRPATPWDRNRAVLERIRSVAREIGTGRGDVAVLCVTKKSVDAMTELLRSSDIPTVGLTEYDGAPVDAVKVGTIKRAKGLEFKHVLIPDIWYSHTAEPPQDDAERERWNLTRRELYVAMTRARDGLWVAIS